jgi:hypothetical protein
MWCVFGDRGGEVGTCEHGIPDSKQNRQRSNAYTLTHTHSFSLSFAHTHTLSLSLSHSHTHILLLSLIRSHTHTLSLSLSFTHTTPTIEAFPRESRKGGCAWQSCLGSSSEYPSRSRQCCGVRMKRSAGRLCTNTPSHRRYSVDATLRSKVPPMSQRRTHRSNDIWLLLFLCLFVRLFVCLFVCLFFSHMHTKQPNK